MQQSAAAGQYSAMQMHSLAQTLQQQQQQLLQQQQQQQALKAAQLAQQSLLGLNMNPGTLHLGSSSIVQGSMPMNNLSNPAMMMPSTSNPALTRTRVTTATSSPYLAAQTPASQPSVAGSSRTFFFLAKLSQIPELQLQQLNLTDPQKRLAIEKVSRTRQSHPQS